MTKIKKYSIINLLGGNKMKNNNKSSISGIDANVIVLSAYLGGLLLTWVTNLNYGAWILPLIIYILERKNEFVKKQSAQATVFFIGTALITMIFNIIWLIVFPSSYLIGTNLSNFAGSTLIMSIMSIISLLISIFITVIVIITSSKTWNYEDYKIPLIGDLVPLFRNLVDKLLDNNMDTKNANNVILKKDIDLTKKEDKIKKEKNNNKK